MPLNPMMQQKRLGVSPHLYCRPLIQPLSEDPLFHVVIDTPRANATRLRELALCAVLIPPLDYAREASQFKIIPGIAISSRAPNSAIAVHFREGIHNVATVAVDPTTTAEITLAKILLAEEFDIAPTLVPVVGSLEQMLQKADAALLVGDAAFHQATSHLNRLDLVEAWNEMTQLPYVHALWCGRSEELTPPEVERIQKAKEQSSSVVIQIVNEAPSASAFAFQEYLQGFSYDLTEEEELGITEFFHYAYYHGVLPDIPKLNFYSEDAENDHTDPL